MKSLLSPSVSSMRSSLPAALDLDATTKRRLSMASVHAAKKVASMAQKHKDAKEKKIAEEKEKKEAEGRKAGDYMAMINKYKLRSVSVSATDEESNDLQNKLFLAATTVDLKKKVRRRTL